MDISCDMGESCGPMRYGDDAGLAPYMDTISVACGYHGGGPATIARTVDLALRHGLRVGAHPSFPDREGFGRRRMLLTREEVREIVLYQVGALKGFLDARGLVLDHVKPHGMLYYMSGEDTAIAEGFVDAVEVFGAPVVCYDGHGMLEVADRRGLARKVEFYVDVPLDDAGAMILDKSRRVDPDWVAARALRAVREGVVDSAGGKVLSARFDMLTVHNDMPNPVEVARALRASLQAAG